ncbi:RNA polymerase sigma factor [Frigoriflavimonas asaccharolytica]|uniref:RNA polymerase sigma-70 factor (ECF subfamily) n=1 Tax=Frigoriflavimonas asaccharolytica TaxID=2735899 RepID=A0A8J8G578_9FLAO|nr:sigma-70 family RNA polymerase sigma factor [Frigoriflavimonas asaccharolytica]NRS90965.1 RNA polymerase sigma-70 factor (ECF subfamily) [Frigoriflavimonas asaccharolytica]
MNEYTDSKLVNLYQNGDENALEILINRHQREIFTYIFYKILNKDLANDIFQDAFMKIIVTLKKGKYNEEGKFILWAKRIAHNLVIDHYRLKAKNRNISETTYSNEEFSILDMIQETSENIEESLITHQINSDLAKLLVQLPEKQQEVIKLRFFDNMSFKEIADHTECSINTTLGRVRYALINLRKIKDENNIILTR